MERWFAKNEHKGATLIMLSTVAFCIMSGLVRYASGIDPYKTTLFRFIIGLGMLGTAALFGKIRLSFNHGRLLFLRGLVGSIGILICFWSISTLGVGKGTVLIYAFPIFGSIFSALLLKEKVGVVRFAAILTAFVGIYLLASTKNNGSAFLGIIGKKELLAIVGAMFGGLALVIVKKLHDTDSSYAIYFSQCVIGLWVVAVPANLVPCSIGLSGGLLLVAIGISATVGQLLSTEGIKYLDVSTGSLLGMLVPVINYFTGVIIFHETVSWGSVIGSAAVIGSCVIVILKNNNSSK